MRGFPLSRFMRSTEEFLSEALGSVPCRAWHREVGHDLRVLVWVAPLMGCVTFFVVVVALQ